MSIYLSWIYFFICFFLFPESFLAIDTQKLEYKDQVLVEDFESITLTRQMFHIQANTNYLPEIRMSKHLTSPDLNSNTSLLIRIPPEGTGIPIDLVFQKPYILEDYIIEFEINLYSNQANGELFFYLLDTKFQKYKVLMANLNYDGWKRFRIPIGNKISQKDYILGKPSFVKLTGIQFSPSKKETKNKEDIIAIDDIFIIKRKKFLFPKSLEEFPIH